jgi:hypothetical protein
VLEKRTRHIVLYQDNMVGDTSAGIPDDDWVKARSGFIVEMGNRKEHGSFKSFQDRILKGVVAGDEAQGHDRHIAYRRGDRNLNMRWNDYSEEYAARLINGRPDPWTRYLQSPEFAVNDSGSLSAGGAELRTTKGKTMWLLSSPSSGTAVAYQSNAGQELPMELKSAAGTLKCSSMPFGKAVLRRAGAGTVALDIDASYRPYWGSAKGLKTLQGSGGLPGEWLLESGASQLQVKINGLQFQAKRESRNGRQVWVVNPYGHAEELRTR